MNKSEKPPKTICCNAPIKVIEVKPESGKFGNNLFLYCGECLTLMDGNGFKLVSGTEKIA